MVYIYCLNGKKWFGYQAILGIVHDTLLPLVLIGIILCGFSLNGAIMGLTVTALIGCTVGHFYCRFEPATDKFPALKIIRFGLPVTVFAIFTAALLNLDLLLLKGILKENIQVGFYTAAKTLAITPFFISIALSRSIFPAIAKSVMENNHVMTRQYIQHSMKLLLVWMIPVVTIISATANEIVLFIYSTPYVSAATPLSILIIGFGFFTIYLILTTIITAGDKPVISMWINIILLIISVLINICLIPRYGIIGASIGTSIAMIIGVIISAVYVFIKFKALIQPISVARIIMATVPVYLLSLCIQVHGFWIIGWYGLLAIGYLSILILTREIKMEEVIRIRQRQ